MKESYFDAKNRVLDLDAAQAERLQKDGGEVKSPRVILRGTTYELPLELPANYIIELGEVESGRGNIRTCIKIAFGEENADGVIDAMDIHDLKIILRKLPKLYGAEEGESEGSSSS